MQAPEGAIATPAWLLQPEPGLCPCGRSGRRRGGAYLQQTITHGAGVLRQTMFSDDTGPWTGLLQRIDPRAKLLCLLGLVVVSALLRSVPLVLSVYAGTLLLAAASALPLGFFIKRVWLLVPICTGIVLLPATLSAVNSGDVVLPLWHWHGQAQGFTRQGLTGSALLISRVAASAGLVVLLALTTPWHRFLAGLRSLGVPRVLVLAVAAAYRFLFLLLGSVIALFQYRRIRTVGLPRPDRRGHAVLAAAVGGLFGRSLAAADEMHQAMVARGFRGDALVPAEPGSRLLDVVFVLATVAAAALLLIGDRGLGL